MRLQKHVKVGAGIGGISGLAVFAPLLTISRWEWEQYAGHTELGYFLWLVQPSSFLGLALAVVLGAVSGTAIFWLLGHLFRFIRHQWNLAAERQVHKRLLKAKQLFDAGIYTELEYQAKLQEIKAG